MLALWAPVVVAKRENQRCTGITEQCTSRPAYLEALLWCRELQQAVRLLHGGCSARLCSAGAGSWAHCGPLVGLLAAVAGVLRPGWQPGALEAEHDRPGLRLKVSNPSSQSLLGDMLSWGASCPPVGLFAAAAFGCGLGEQA